MPSVSARGDGFRLKEWVMGEDVNIRAEIPTELEAAVGVYERATGRQRDDVVAGALRTYLADQAARVPIRNAFEGAGVRCPVPFVVRARVSLDESLGEAERTSLVETLGLIARFFPVTVSWSDERTFVVEMGASGFDASEAETTVGAMLRNRVEGELGMSVTNLTILSSAPLER
jgi:hypothetical protein